MWTRRKALITGSLCTAGCALPPLALGRRAAAQDYRTPHTMGCYLADEDVEDVYPDNTDTRLYINGDEPMIPKSGDRNFDYALAQTLAMICWYLSVTPGFAYYDDYDGENAYATKKRRLNGADGTVLFGQGLLQKMRAGPDHPEIAVAGICAHEFGHILQYKLGLDKQVLEGQSTVKRLELQADFFSGYFGGRRKLDKPTFLAAIIAQTQYKFGDTKFQNENHHGTPDERAAAVVFGYKTAYNEKKALEEAIDISTQYVMQL